MHSSQCRRRTLSLHTGQDDRNGGYDYLATFLGPEGYTVAFTCQDLDESSEASEDIAFSATANAKVADDDEFNTELIETPVAQRVGTRAARRPGIEGRAIGASQQHLTMSYYFITNTLLPPSNTEDLADCDFSTEMSKLDLCGTPSFLETQLITLYTELRVSSNLIDELAHEQK